MNMIKDQRLYDFNNCQMCRGLALLIPIGEDCGSVRDTRKANNKAQAKMMVNWLAKRGISEY